MKIELIEKKIDWLFCSFHSKVNHLLDNKLRCNEFIFYKRGVLNLLGWYNVGFSEKIDLARDDRRWRARPRVEPSFFHEINALIIVLLNGLNGIIQNHTSIKNQLIMYVKRKNEKMLLMIRKVK